ncbi:MAG TPA: ABC transporter permease [Solirubrobacteraceae bacterium]|nr:ABC transporter permease [Solirubrobacteraceae bacterium]
MRVRLFPLALAAAAGLTVAFLTLPVVALFTHGSPGRLLDALAEPSSRQALWLSLETSGIAIAIVVLVGTPAAWVLATVPFPGRGLVVTLVELPLVLPPAVAGLALLVAFGPEGMVGEPLGDAGVVLPFHTAAVVVALVFVSAPFHIRQAQAAFAALDPSLLEASRTLGASPARTFLRVAVPSVAGALVTGAALALARALGEFGATLMFAGSLEGVTRTASLAVYDRFGVDLDGALALSAVLVGLAAILLVAVKLAGERVAAR